MATNTEAVAIINRFIVPLKEDNVAECERLVREEGTDHTARAKYGVSLIHFSSYHINTTTLDWILTECGKVGLSAEDTSEDGATALVYAARGDKIDNCRWLLENGVNMAVRTNEENTLFHLSSGLGKNTKTLDWVLTERLKAGLSIEDTDESGYTPLAKAIMRDNIDNRRWLLAKGANLAMRTNDGRCLLHVSSQCSNNTDTLDWVLTEGLKVGLSIEAATKKGLSSIMYAVAGEKIDNCRWLLEKGANVAVRTYEENTLLHVSSEFSKNTKTLDWVLTERLKAGLSFEDTDENGYTPLAKAIMRDKIDNCCWLLEKGANMAVRMKDQRTLLHVSSQSSKSTSTVAWVLTEGLKVGLSIEDMDKYCFTALLCAVEGRKLDNVKWLLARGADLNARTNQGCSVLHECSCLGYSNVLEYLLDLVPIEMLNERETTFGLTPVRFSAQLKHFDCVRLLATKALQVRN